ncbi:MAG TPA: FixG Ig-like domain-containing protein, partial [Acidimicrobiales bacterium]|nr:FixG Ig-like domain-containing protein [Acidimicrobiales bacterium]
MTFESPVPILSINVQSAEVTPGEPAVVHLAVRNDGTSAVAVELDVAGLAPDSVTLPGALGPLASGETAWSSLRVLLPAGFPASDLQIGLIAHALSPVDGSRYGRPATADFVLHVAETGLLEASVPDDVFGAFRGRFEIRVVNRGSEPQHAELSASSPAGARVHLKKRQLQLAPGEVGRARADIEAPRALVGAPRRVPFVVKVKGRGAPVTVSSTFVQSPMISTVVMKALAMFTTIAIVGTLAFFVLGKVTGGTNTNLAAPVTLATKPHLSNVGRSKGGNSTGGGSTKSGSLAGQPGQHGAKAGGHSSGGS